MTGCLSKVASLINISYERLTLNASYRALVIKYFHYQKQDDCYKTFFQSLNIFFFNIKEYVEEQIAPFN